MTEKMGKQRRPKCAGRPLTIDGSVGTLPICLCVQAYAHLLVGTCTDPEVYSKGRDTLNHKDIYRDTLLCMSSCAARRMVRA